MRLLGSNAAQSTALLFVFAGCLLFAGILSVVRKLKTKVAEKVNASLEAFDTGSPRGELNQKDKFFIKWASFCSGASAGIVWVADYVLSHVVPVIGNNCITNVLLAMILGFVAQTIIQKARGGKPGPQPYQPQPTFPPYQPQPGPNDPLLQRHPQPPYPNPHQPPPPLA